jgi:hypothetical protein
MTEANLWNTSNKRMDDEVDYNTDPEDEYIEK